MVESSPTQTIVALGSNLGDRYQYLLSARKQLLTLPQCDHFRFSSIYETASVGTVEGAPDYLNAVVCFDTYLNPYALLEALLRIENEYGRERPYVNAPRTLDLDLIFYGSEVIIDTALIIPHPRMHERFFVLTPLAEICPDLLHPVFDKTVKQMEQELNQGDVDNNVPKTPSVKGWLETEISPANG